MTQTKQTSRTLRLNKNRATVIKLAIENYEEIAKLNLTNEEYIELLTVKNECGKIASLNSNQLLQRNSNQLSDTDSKKVSE